ncbi:MAG TPA: RNA polymerase sigma factor [Bacillota bacterium]|nr:RNA polymerase sigma factor [Bacillota bacterium]HOL16460.1 RNA polymerase sigma factor [Bacillota bacterium]
MERERVAQLVRQNDDASRRELFEIFYRRTYAAVFAILRHRESAEDITQDAFIKAFQNITRLREKEKFGPWLAAIATNLARNHLKREKRLYYSGNPVEPEAGSAQITPSSTEEQVIREEEIARVRAALRTLPPEQYQVVIMQYFYDLKLAEIARLLKISPGTAKSRLFRARVRLSRVLEPKEDLICQTDEGGGVD